MCRQPGGGAHVPAASGPPPKAKTDGGNTANTAKTADGATARAPPKAPPGSLAKVDLKQVPCYNLADGYCKHGDNCKSRHVPPITAAEKALRLKNRPPSPKNKAAAEKTPPPKSKAMCKNWTKEGNSCRYGEQCMFVHPGHKTLAGGAADAESPPRRRSRSASRRAREKATKEKAAAQTVAK